MTSPILHTDKLRDLDALEKLFWLTDQHSYGHFSVVADVSGTASIETWRRALGVVGRKSPLVGAQIIVGSDGNPYFRAGAPRGVSVTVVHGDLDNWTSHVASELAVPFDVTSEPLVRARLLHEPVRSVLILTMHHTIADGGSAAYFLRNVLRVAGGDDIQPAVETTSLEQAVDDKGWPAFDMPAPDPSNLPPARYRDTEHAMPRVVALSLSSESTEAIRVRARRERTTIHGALCAAAARAFTKLLPDHPVNPPRVFSPVDARRRLLGESDRLGVFLSGLTATSRSSEDFWDQARTFTEKLAPFNDANLLANGVRSVRHVMAEVSTVKEATDIWAYVFGAEVLVTNLAKFDMPTSYGDLTLNDVWGPAVSLGIEAEQTIGVITVGGRLHLLHTSQQPLDGFLEEMSSDLAAAAA